MTEQYSSTCDEFDLYFETVNFLESSGCTSYSRLALMNPELWLRLRLTPSVRMRVAVRQGWPLGGSAGLHKPDSQEGLYAAMNAVLNLGSNDPHLIWFEMPMQCVTLHRAGWLDTLLTSLGINSRLPETKTSHGLHPSIFEYFPGVRELLDNRPADGWATRGGRVMRLAELMLTRYLELHEMVFEVVPRVPGQCNFVSVQGQVIGFKSDVDFQDLLPAAKCEAVILDDMLLRIPGDIFAFAYHIRATLVDEGIVAKSRFVSYGDLLSPTVSGNHLTR
ncbi:MAG: hypothetical protein PHD37_01000 [Gallionellaceae bacterium]|nr:hypothetical protein [Gallionellaceae bacterium]